MSDRFKFRFWRFNDVEKKWKQEIFADLMSIDGSGLPFDNTEGGAYTEYDTEYITEQCTGLTDKNGKLIYEGDVVKIYAKNRYAYGIFQIKYDCEDCEYDMLDEEGNFIYQLQNDKTKYVEVVGNIHENPELVK